jgi:hypothetical protein
MHPSAKADTTLSQGHFDGPGTRSLKGDTMDTNPRYFTRLLDKAHMLTPGISSASDLFLEILGGSVALEQLLLLIGLRMTRAGRPRARLFKVASFPNDVYFLAVYNEEYETGVTCHVIDDDGYWAPERAAASLSGVTGWEAGLTARGAEEILPLVEQQQVLRETTRRLQAVTETLRREKI